MEGMRRLLGRDAEMHVITDAIDAAAPLVFVLGDAGIGKSRLVGNVAEAARERGFVVLAGACVSLTAKLPLLPFVQALGGMNEASAATALGRLAPSMAVAASTLMPRVPFAPSGGLDGEVARGDGGGWERERLVLSVAALLTPPVRTKPTLVVIEDLHWADPFTLDLLTYLVAGTRTGATFLVTVRTDQRPMDAAVLEAVGELQRLDAVVTVELGPLSADLVGMQAEDVLGRPAPPELVAELVELGGGNPFFTEQLCRAADTDGSGGQLARDSRTLPPQLSGLLQSRIRRLAEPSRRALLILGVAGIPLSAEQLATAADLTAQGTAEVVRELSDAALLRTVAKVRLAPRHALLATAVAETTDPVTMTWAHARLGALFDAIGDRTHAVAAAGHWAAAGREREELHATLIAAPVAEEMADFALAARLWTRAFILAQQYPERAAEDGSSTLEAAVCAVQALNWAGQTEEAMVLAEDALARLTPVEETLLGGTLLMWVGRFRTIRNRSAGATMLQEAVRVLSTFEPSPALVKSLSYLARTEDRWGRTELAFELAEQAVSRGEHCGSPHAEAEATVTLGLVLIRRGRVDAAIEQTQRLVARPDIAVNVRAQCLLAVFESDLLLQTSRLEQARAVAWAAFELLLREGYGTVFDASVLRYNAAEADLEMGRTGRVMELVEAVTTGCAPAFHTTGDHLLRALADLNAGNLDQALERIEKVSAVSRATDSTEDIRLTAQGAATILRWARHPGRALDSVMTDLQLLVGTDQHARSSELLTVGAAAAADLLAEAHARADNPGTARAERALDSLVRLADAIQPSPFEPLLDGGREQADQHQWQAELSRAAGASEPELWRSAALQWEAQSRPHRAAYCWWRLAQGHVDRGEPRSAIATALQRAYELSAEMQPVRAAVEEIALRAHLKLTTRPEPRGTNLLELPVALTERELEVLRHVAAGRSNAQIADDLFISPKTVSVHVSNLMRKIGVDNRVQAAAWADSVGVLDGPSADLI